MPGAVLGLEAALVEGEGQRLARRGIEHLVQVEAQQQRGLVVVSEDLVVDGQVVGGRARLGHERVPAHEVERRMDLADCNVQADAPSARRPSHGGRPKRAEGKGRAGRGRTLLEPLGKPVRVQRVFLLLGILDGLAGEAVLDGDLTSVLVAQQGAHNGALEASLVCAGDVVGNLQDGKRVEGDVQSRIGLLAGKQLVPGAGPHGEGGWTRAIGPQKSLIKKVVEWEVISAGALLLDGGARKQGTYVSSTVVTYGRSLRLL
ncbi:hypothetical protein VTK73DRAFT_6442 [Phialemonium thermophilum]|uniref:Uncharacterized protein n=1 Tax=Phialemonium thermophilum TaxID=223376 RepID=A0ABR3UZM0_9PEZI